MGKEKMNFFTDLKKLLFFLIFLPPHNTLSRPASKRKKLGVNPFKEVQQSVFVSRRDK